MKIAPFKYERETPAGYECGMCGAKNCKMWRPVHRDSEARCARCLAPHMEIDLMGQVWDPRIQQHHDQVAGWLPFIPDEDGESTWGYSSVPNPGVRWWRSLPTYEIETCKHTHRILGYLCRECGIDVKQKARDEHPCPTCNGAGCPKLANGTFDIQTRCVTCKGDGIKPGYDWRGVKDNANAG